MSDPDNLPSNPTINESSLTKREFLSLLALGLTVAGGAAAIALVPGPVPPAVTAASAALDRPRQLVSFSLTERSGRNVTQTELAGQFLVVDFVFTSCSLRCRAVNDCMAEIQRRMADTPDVRLVSLTVDPRSDTPAVLARFADRYHADPNRWLFLTGDKAEVYCLIESSFISPSPELASFIPGGFTQTDRIMLVDPHGNVFASVNGLKAEAAAAVVAEIVNHRKSHPSR